MADQLLVLLLRGINVGPHKRIGMAELRATLEGLGFDDVRTLLQSGNAVVRGGRSPAAARKAVERAIREDFGFEVDVVVRTGAELEAVVEADPFGAAATDPKRYVVLFLSAAPDAAVLEAVGERDFAPEEFRAVGREPRSRCCSLS